MKNPKSFGAKKSRGSQNVSGRNNQVSRIYRILTILENHHFGLSVSEIWEKLADQGFEVGERTIYRDLEALEQAGFPLGEKGRTDEGAAKWVLEAHSKIGQVFAITAREVLALYFTKKALTPLKGLPFYQDLQGLLEKLEDRLGSKNSSYLKELQQELPFESRSLWAKGIESATVEAVQAACSEGQVLEVTYASVHSKSRRKRRIGAHYLYFAQGSLYLVGEDLEDHKIKTFALPRMTDATILDEAYKSERTSPGLEHATAFGIFKSTEVEHVRLIFREPVATYVTERVWHPSQRVLSRSDDQVEIELEVGLCPELTGWVLSFGRHASVVAPPSLAESVRQEASAILSVIGRPQQARDQAS